MKRISRGPVVVLHAAVDRNGQALIDALDTHLRSFSLEVFTYEWHPKLDPEMLLSDGDCLVVVFAPPRIPEDVQTMTTWQRVAVETCGSREHVMIASWAGGRRWVPSELRKRPMFWLDEGNGLANLGEYLKGRTA